MPMDCDQIIENLFVGSCLLDSKDFEDLRPLAITAILSLQTDEDMGQRDIGWEEKAALNAKLAFRNVPVRDFDAADLQRKLPECVAVLDYMLKSGHTVYLHCTAGTGRSPSVAVAYLHWCLAWPLERALTHVRDCRTCSPNVEVIRCARWPI
jgi:protein-tyrosine phosphatase